jgi:hypothetical protein
MSQTHEISPVGSPGTRRVIVRYGPYTLPGYNESTPASKMENAGGMLAVMLPNATRPCSNCVLKYAKANLEYADGSIANINTGSWLHHLKVSAVGPKRIDLGCNTKGEERFFASHNDRRGISYGAAKEKRGFYIDTTDTMLMDFELQNEYGARKEGVYLTMDWTFIHGKPAGYKQARMLWLDAAKCGGMSDLAPLNQQAFTLESKPWVSYDNYDMLWNIGHMHDGGISVDFFSNNRTICESKATYGGNRYYRSSSKVVDGEQKTQHISAISTCGKEMGKLKKGDSLVLKAHYDFVKQAGMKDLDGVYGHVMGIGLMIVGTTDNI